MKFTTDKVWHGYLPTYLSIAGEIGIHGRVCEVGVLNGASLDMWQALFPEGVVVGVDVSPQAYWPPGTLQVVCEQTAVVLPERVAQACPQYDLIVDDASHEGDKTAVTFRLLWPLVAPGGWYVIEDWQVGLPSYMQDYMADNETLEMAHNLLLLLDRKSEESGVEEGGVEEIRYRWGMIILRKRK